MENMNEKVSGPENITKAASLLKSAVAAHGVSQMKFQSL